MFCEGVSSLQISLILSRTIFKFCYSRSRTNFTLGLDKPSHYSFCGLYWMPWIFENPPLWIIGTPVSPIPLWAPGIFEFIASWQLFTWLCGVSLPVDSWGPLIRFLCIAVFFLVLANCSYLRIPGLWPLSPQFRLLPCFVWGPSFHLVSKQKRLVIISLMSMFLFSQGS